MKKPRIFLVACYLSLPALAPIVARLSAATTEPGWISLFDGKSLAGWKAGENPNSFRVVDGAITTDGPRAHLFYVGEGPTPASFENFEFSAEVKTKPGTNSGIYFHTAWLAEGWPTGQGFEVQVDNSQPLQGNYIENKRTGSLYGIRNVYPRLARDDEWFTLSIAVHKPRVEVRLNGVLVVDYVEPAEPLPASAPKFNHLVGGTFALQAHDVQSHAFFRNLRVRPLPPTPAGSVAQRPLDSETAVLLPLAKDNFPLVDLHLMLDGNAAPGPATAHAQGTGEERSLVTLERVLARSRETGVGVGIVAYDPKSSTRHSSPQTDAAAAAFLERMKGQPVFLVLRPENRDWVKAISPATRARFDCIIADAMTFTPEPHGDPEEFMDKLVAQTVAILANEPVDILANPTYLPFSLASQADTLWTEARMQQVIAVAVAKGVALEINSVHALPTARFVELAKAAGAKFSVGSGETYTEVTDHSYAWEMQKKSELTWRNMYAPGHQPTRAQREIAAK